MDKDKSMSVIYSELCTTWQRACLNCVTVGTAEMSRNIRKPVFGVSDQVPHKPGCTTTEDG